MIEIKKLVFRVRSRYLITFVLAFTLIVSPALSRTAHSDEPVTITVGGWIAITAAAGGISWLVGKALDSIFSSKPPKKKTTLQRQVTVRLPNGTIIEKTETKIVDPPLTDLSPVATTSYPTDWIVAPGPPLPGDLTAGTIQGRIEPGQHLVQDTSSLAVGSSVIDMANAFGAVAGTDEWIHAETVDSYFRRSPLIPRAEVSTFSFNPTGSVQLTTTDLQKTTATVGLAYAISADVIDTTGTLPTLVDHASFTGGIEIDQGALTADFVGDSIPGAVAKVISPGVLDISFSGDPLLTFPIPSGYDFVQLSANTIYTGKATLLPPPTILSGIVIDSPPVTLDIDGDVDITAGAEVDVTPDYSQASATLETILAVTFTGTLTGLFANEGEHLRDGIFVDAITYNPNDITVDLLQAASGDVNGDRLVDSTDIQLILAANSFNNPAGGPYTWLQGDNTGDGLVDATDIQNILAANLFGTGAYAALPANVTVPEPSSLVLAVIALLGLLAYSRRRRA